jgi:hypothetical protein
MTPDEGGRPAAEPFVMDRIVFEAERVEPENGQSVAARTFPD